MKKDAIRHTLNISKHSHGFSMSSSRPLKIQNAQTYGQSGNLLDHETPRLVLTLTGQIFYANDAFMALCGEDIARGTNFLNMAEFAEPEDVFRNSSLLFAAEDNVFTGLRSGRHGVIFKNSAIQIPFQFDSIKSSNGTSYIIASAMEHDEAFSRDVENLINKGDAQENPNVRAFLDLSNDVLCSSGTDGRMSSINKTFTALLGYHFEDLEGRGFLDLVHPDDKAAVHTSMNQLLRQHTDSDIVDFECRMISKEARVLWMNWKHRTLEGVLYSAGSDITSVKKHQMALQKHEQQLLEAEAIGHMGHWHWVLGSQEIRFSDEIYRIFGTSKDKFHATLDSVNERLHRRDAGRMEQAFQRAVIEQNDHEIDFRVLTPAGETRHVRCLGRCEFDHDGDVIGLYGIMQDVTESMQNERALMEAKDAAERAYAAKSQFLANMSHELRTPLNAIIGFSEMMQQQLLGPIGNERYLDYIKGINESGQHLLDLITDILDMSKIEAGKYELNLEEVNAAKVIRLAAHMVESRANENSIKININIPDENIKIVADRRALMQMTLNLLSNAVKFSHPQGRVDITFTGGNGFVTLNVKDNGIGIPANKLPTITNPFEQAANQYTRSHEGSGLGLSITKELAELHGGSIHIESTLNVGTSVTIRLPVRAQNDKQK